MSTDNNNVYSDFANFVDTEIDTKRRKLEEKRNTYNEYRQLFLAFIESAVTALNKAASIINARSTALGRQAWVEARLAGNRKDDLGAIIYVHVPRNDQLGFNRQVGDPRADCKVDLHFDEDPAGLVHTYWRWDFWVLHVHVYIGEDGVHQNFEIQGQRGHWWDWWEAEISTPECDPTGLSLNSPGDFVAEKFIAWFERYLI